MRMWNFQHIVPYCKRALKKNWRVSQPELNLGLADLQYPNPSQLNYPTSDTRTESNSGKSSNTASTEYEKLTLLRTDSNPGLAQPRVNWVDRTTTQGMASAFDRTAARKFCRFCPSQTKSCRSASLGLGLSCRHPACPGICTEWESGRGCSMDPASIHRRSPTSGSASGRMVCRPLELQKACTSYNEHFGTPQRGAPALSWPGVSGRPRPSIYAGIRPGQHTAGPCMVRALCPVCMRRPLIIARKG